jgi:hypothetical protein
MKSCTRSRLGQQMEMSGQLHAPAILIPAKQLMIPIQHRLGGPQLLSGHSGNEEIVNKTAESQISFGIDLCFSNRLILACGPK